MRLTDAQIDNLEDALRRNEVATSEQEAAERVTMVRALIAEVREIRKAERFVHGQRTTATRRGRR